MVSFYSCHLNSTHYAFHINVTLSIEFFRYLTYASASMRRWELGAVTFSDWMMVMWSVKEKVFEFGQPNNLTFVVNNDLNIYIWMSIDQHASSYCKIIPAQFASSLYCHQVLCHVQQLLPLHLYVFINPLFVNWFIRIFLP